LREDAGRLRRELREQLVLLARKRYQATADRHAAGRPVDDDLAGLEERRGAAGGPAEDRPDAPDELLVVERAHEVVVAAAGECTHAVDSVRLRLTEDDDRHVAVPR